MSPPLPPSPPEGPPRGTYFSRRNAMQPLPPSPALTRILASSINMASDRIACHAERSEGPWFFDLGSCVVSVTLFKKTKSLVPKARLKPQTPLRPSSHKAIYQERTTRQLPLVRPLR